MEQVFFNFLLEIPQVVAQFASWVVAPISEKYLNVSPLGLLSVGGTAIIVALIVVHVVKLFV